MIPKRRPFIPKKKETEHRLNRDIRVPEVRLVGEEIEPGVYPIEEALRLAKEQEVDLVNHIITAAYQQHLWQPLFDLLAEMSDAAQQQTAPILHKLLATEGQLQQKWQPLIEARQLGHLFV